MRRITLAGLAGPMFSSGLAAVLAAGWALLGCAGAARAQPVPTTVNANLPPVTVPLAPGGYRKPGDPVPEGVGVAERVRDDYLPVGGRIGSFFLFPSFSVTERYSDNVRASDAVEFGDDSVTLEGGAQLVSGFSRHSLKLGGWVERSFYLHHTDENASQYGGSFAGRIDLPRTTIDLGTTVERRLLPREDFNSPVTARSPLPYDRVHGSLGITQTFNRLSVAVSGAITRLTYLNVIDDNGVVLDERYRSATVVGGVVELTYSVRPGFAAFARGSVTRVSYLLSPVDPAQPGGLDRDSHGWQAEVGARIDLSRVVYAVIRVGYLSRTYDDPRLREARGVSFGADVLWNVTALTSLRFSADRRIEQNDSQFAAGNRVTEFGVAIEHELRRNVILTAKGSHTHFEPLGPVPANDQWRVAAGARYLLNRRFSLKIDYRHDQRTAVDPTRSFAENAVMLGLTLTL